MTSTYLYGLGIIFLIAIASTYAFSILGWSQFTPWAIGAVTWLLFAGSIMMNIILRSVPPTVYLVKDEGEEE